MTENSKFSELFNYKMFKFHIIIAMFFPFVGLSTQAIKDNMIGIKIIFNLKIVFFLALFLQIKGTI